jgi:V-type H+-transporting ATPase subunit a
VIIGVIHMLFGIVMKGVNSVFFRNWVDLIFEFVP